jgi:hypothetical protein
MLNRLLWLQRQVRRAVRGRRTEEAAHLARAALETCIVGLYCLFGTDAVARLAAANYRAAGKAISYMTTIGLVSKDAIDAAVASLGTTGPNLNISDLADKLASDHDMPFMRNLYSAYYMPLSHFHVHANAFTLMRHIGPDGAPQRKPSPVWSRRPAARLADACMGLLAGNIASQANGDPAPFLAYAQAHLDRLLTPALVMSVREARHSLRLRHLPAVLGELRALRAYVHGHGQADDPVTREAHIRGGLDTLLRQLVPGAPPGMFTQASAEFAAAAQDAMPPAPAEQQ